MGAMAWGNSSWARLMCTVLVLYDVYLWSGLATCAPSLIGLVWTGMGVHHILDWCSLDWTGIGVQLPGYCTILNWSVMDWTGIVSTVLC